MKITRAAQLMRIKRLYESYSERERESYDRGAENSRKNRYEGSWSESNLYSTSEKEAEEKQNRKYGYDYVVPWQME